MQVATAFVAVDEPDAGIFERADERIHVVLIEGATENTAVVQALIDNLIERGLGPAES
jgi:hypothetical protein